MINNVELNLLVFIDEVFGFQKAGTKCGKRFYCFRSQIRKNKWATKKVKMDFRRESHSILSLLPRQEMIEFS